MKKECTHNKYITLEKYEQFNSSYISSYLYQPPLPAINCDECGEDIKHLYLVKCKKYESNKKENRNSK